MNRVIDILFGFDPSTIKEGTQWVFRLTSGIPAWLAIVAVVFFAGWSYYNYNREETDASGPMRRLIMCLRILTLLTVGWILLGPAIVLIRSQTEPSHLLLLVDKSASMSIPFDSDDDAAAPRRPTRAEAVGKAFAKTDFIARLSEKHNVIAYTFDGRLYPADTAAVANAGADGNLTALGDAVIEAIGENERIKLAGIVVVTDGVENSGSGAARAADTIQRNPPCQITGIVVGATEKKSDARIETVFMPSVFYTNDISTFKVVIGQNSFTGQRATVRLRIDGRIVASEEVNLLAAENDVNLTFTPGEKGRFDALVELVPPDGDALADNNEWKSNIEIKDMNIRLLLISGAPTWEYRYLKTMFMREDSKHVTFSSFLMSANTDFVHPGHKRIRILPSKIEEWREYDVIILHNVYKREGFFHSDEVRDIVRWVREDAGGLIVTGAARYPLAEFGDTQLGEILPVTIDRTVETPGALAASIRDPFHPEVTPAGLEHPTVMFYPNPDANREIWKVLPGYYWYQKVLRRKQQATVILRHPSDVAPGDGLPMPIMAVNPAGEGEVMFLALDDTWRMREIGENRHYYRFWAQIVNYMAMRKLRGGGDIRLRFAAEKIDLGRPAWIYARLLDSQLNPSTRNSVNVAVSGPRDWKKNIEIGVDPARPGAFQQEIDLPYAGDYTAEIEVDGVRVEAQTTVAQPNFEFSRTEADKTALEVLARATNGRVLGIDALGSLPDQIEPRIHVTFSEKRYDLFDAPFWLILFVVLLTLEWVLRKIYKML